MHNPFKKLAKAKFPEKRTKSKVKSVRKSEEDMDLFWQAMADVKPLKQKGPEVPGAKKKTVSKVKEDKELDKFLAGNFEFLVEYTDEYLQGVVKGVNQKILNKLKRGEFSIEATLDLHGFTVDDARIVLLEFIRDSYIQNKRCLLLIPGRGINSPLGFGILKREVQGWLTREPLKRIVLAFCSALPCHGGAGAIYVLLRKYKKSRGKIIWDRYLYPE